MLLKRERVECKNGDTAELFLLKAPLEEYLERARSDGRPYLLSCADRILSRRKRPGA